MRSYRAEGQAARRGLAIWLPVAFLGIGLVFTVIALLLWSPIRSARIDACLDSGGSFDYERDTCDHEKNHPGP